MPDRRRASWSQPRHPVGQLRDGQGVEQLDVSQPATTALEIRFGAMGDLAAALPPRTGLGDQFVESAADVHAPLSSDTTDQQVAQLHVAGNVACFEHSECCRHVGGRNLKRLRKRPHAVVEFDVRVPQRVPQAVRDLGHDRRVHVVVQQNQIEIGIRQQFASAETTHGDDGKPTIRFDAQFGPLGGQPEFVQIDQCMSQRGGVELLFLTPPVSRALRARARSAASSDPPDETGPGPVAFATEPGPKFSDPFGSECIATAFPGANPDDRLDWRDPHLAVTDLAGSSGLDDHLDHLVHGRVVDDDLDPDLGYEVHGVLRARYTSVWPFCRP